MRLIKPFAACLLVCCLLAAAPRGASARGQISLKGQISLDGHGAPPRFSVRLYFPRTANRPPIVTATNDRGEYMFTELDAGRYLLEVYQGEEMVYQKAIDLTGDQDHNVQLRAKKGSD